MALLGAATMILVYFRWLKLRATPEVRASAETGQLQNSSAHQLLIAPNEQGSVVEADTKRFEAEAVAMPRQAEHR